MTTDGPGPASPLGPVDSASLRRRKDELAVQIAVCLPARDEAATVGTICRSIAEDLLEPGLVDQLLVMDSRSEDDTEAVARAAGAEVYGVSEVLPGLPGFDGGKGEALWKSLAVARGDVIVWMDADTRNFSSDFALRLIEPLLASPDVLLTKAFYERPIVEGNRLMQAGGARVTELVARPLLNLFFPELAGVIQPLAGEYAVRTAVARSVPFLSGYAPDIGLLMWVAQEFGVERVAQVDLGVRVHRNQDLSALGRMAFEVMQGMFRALEGFGRLNLQGDLPESFTQFDVSGKRIASNDFRLPVVELPRMNSLLA